MSVQRLRMHTAAVLCAVVLLLCTLVMAYYLFSLHEKNPPASLDGGMLGMILIDISNEEAAAFYHVNAFGVYVLAVDEDSPAFEAGVRSGDCIVSANGQLISSASELSTMQEEGVREFCLIFSREGCDPFYATLFNGGMNEGEKRKDAA